MDKATKRWLDKAFKASRKAVDSSDNFLGIYTAHYVDDPVCLLQLGYAMVADKPIFLIAEEGVSMPGKLRMVAQGIEWFKKGDEEAATMRLCTKIAEVLGPGAAS